MTLDRLRFAESVLEGWNALDDEGRSNARRALERIADDPIIGVPLAEPVKGYWSVREGPLRIVYRIVPESGTVIVVRLTKVEESRQG